MAKAVHAVVKFNRTSGIPRDVVENTWNFGSDDGVTDIDLTHLTAALQTFYDTESGVMTAYISQYLNATVSRVVVPTVDYYDLDGHLAGGPLGAPIGSAALTLHAPISAVELPDEVAVCLSYRGAYGGDVEHGPGGSRPRARDRGRLFIGPLVGGADTLDSSSGVARVASGFRDNLRLAALATLGYLNTVNEGWAVWSRKNGILINVVDGWIDNAFDTQRRRGEEATARTTW